MPSDTLEGYEMELPELEVDVEVTGPDVEDPDPRFVDLYRVVVLARATLEEIHGRLQDGSAFEYDYVAELLVAHQTGARLIQRDDAARFAADFSRLDAETLAELRSTVGYVAPHLGVDLDLPAPDDSDSDETARGNDTTR
jgi:hypothetical protein